MATESKNIVIAHWVTRLIAAGILAMGAIPKFTGGAGELAEKLPGGNSATLAIGIAEVTAIILMLVPKTTLLGSSLASVIMLGAVLSHFGPVGMEGDFMTMFFMAIVAFLAASGATGIAWRRGMRFSGGSAASSPPPVGS